MNYLNINNQYITTLQGLKECFLQEEARQLNSSLFEELKEYYRSGEIADFLYDIGEEDLSNRIREIKSSESDKEMMKSLIAIMTEEDVKVDFDPLEYVEIVRTDIVGNQAVMGFKVKKQAREQVKLIICQQGNKGVALLHKLSDEKYGDVMMFGLTIDPKEGDVFYMVDNIEIERRPIRKCCLMAHTKQDSMSKNTMLKGVCCYGDDVHDVNNIKMKKDLIAIIISMLQLPLNNVVYLLRTRDTCLKGRKT